MVDAGLLVYYGVIRDMAHIAGVYDQDDWFTVEDRVQRFKPLFNDEYGGHLIGELVGYISLRSQQGSEYHMSKFSGAPGVPRYDPKLPVKTSRTTRPCRSPSRSTTISRARRASSDRRRHAVRSGVHRAASARLCRR